QGAAGACEIALVTDRIRSKDGLREGLAQCTMGGKPAGVKSSSGAHAHLLLLARRNLDFAYGPSQSLDCVSPERHLAAGTRASIDRSRRKNRRRCLRPLLRQGTSGLRPHPRARLRRNHMSAAREAGMQRKVMISCAVTGSADTPGRNPAVPVTPEQIAQSAIDAAKAGAAIAHIPLRHP